MTDIVIPMGTGSRWNDNELRYTLRGIEKYLSGYRNIYIIGHKPEWLQNVTHIPFPDYSRLILKEKNICDKLREACRCNDISDTFLMFNDDFFLLKRMYASSVPYYYDGTLRVKYKKLNEFNPYKKTIRNTLHYLQNNFMNTEHQLNYEVHGPILFNKDLFKEVVSPCDWINNPHGFGMRALYGNIINVQGCSISDLKINEPLPITDLHDMKFSGRSFFSIGNKGLNTNMKEFLQYLYPVPSIFEQ